MNTSLTRATAMAYALALQGSDWYDADRPFVTDVNNRLSSFLSVPEERIDIRRQYAAGLAACCLHYLADSEERDPQVTKHPGWWDTNGVPCPYCGGAGGFVNAFADEGGDVSYDGSACDVCGGKGGIGVQPYVVANPFRVPALQEGPAEYGDAGDPFAKEESRSGTPG